MTSCKQRLIPYSVRRICLAPAVHVYCVASNVQRQSRRLAPNGNSGTCARRPLRRTISTALQPGPRACVGVDSLAICCLLAGSTQAHAHPHAQPENKRIKHQCGGHGICGLQGDFLLLQGVWRLASRATTSSSNTIKHAQPHNRDRRAANRPSNGSRKRSSAYSER